VGSIPTALTTKTSDKPIDSTTQGVRYLSHESCLWAQSWALFVFPTSPSPGRACRNPSPPPGRARDQCDMLPERAWPSTGRCGKSAPTLSGHSSTETSASTGFPPTPSRPATRLPAAAAAAGRRFAAATPASTISNTIDKADVPWRSSDSLMLPPLSAGSGRALSPRSSVNAESASSTRTGVRLVQQRPGGSADRTGRLDVAKKSNFGVDHNSEGRWQPRRKIP
jgi:hypothetical protein